MKPLLLVIVVCLLCVSAVLAQPAKRIIAADIEKLSDKAMDGNAKALAELHDKGGKGNLDAQISLSTLYQLGLGVKKNGSEAVKWMRMAAEQGYAISQSDLGLRYQFGINVALDKAEAAKWNRKAAEQGVHGAQRFLGLLYKSGEGVEKDEAEAYKWLFLASETGDTIFAKRDLEDTEKILTPAQRVEGQKRVQEFKAKRKK